MRDFITIDRVSFFIVFIKFIIFLLIDIEGFSLNEENLLKICGGKWGDVVK